MPVWDDYYGHYTNCRNAGGYNEMAAGTGSGFADCKPIESIANLFGKSNNTNYFCSGEILNLNVGQILLIITKNLNV